MSSSATKSISISRNWTGWLVLKVRCLRVHSVVVSKLYFVPIRLRSKKRDRNKVMNVTGFHPRFAFESSIPEVHAGIALPGKSMPQDSSDLHADSRTVAPHAAKARNRIERFVASHRLPDFLLSLPHIQAA